MYIRKNSAKNTKWNFCSNTLGKNKTAFCMPEHDYDVFNEKKNAKVNLYFWIN